MICKTILFDIIHPANVHYFKYTIHKLKKHGYNVIVTARNKEVSYTLLDSEDIPYIKMGKNINSSFGKILFLLWCEIKTFIIFVRFRPDISLSFGASYIAHNSFLFGVPHIALDDTEHAGLNRKLYLPFTKLVLTPDSYLLNLGKKHVKFPGHMELFYLSPKYFHPDLSIYKLLGIEHSEKYFILRFVSWNALHDKGQTGISTEYKLLLVNELSKIGKVFISAEGRLPLELEKYRIKVPPQLIHHALFFADLFIGEGATMASECAAIGTPAIYINSLNAGTLINQAKEGLIYNFRNEKGVLEIALKILQNRDFKNGLRGKLREMNNQRIDLPSFLCWVITNYPHSRSIVYDKQNWMEQFNLTNEEKKTTYI